MRRRNFQPLAILAVLIAIAVMQLWNRREAPPHAQPTESRAGRMSSPAPSQSAEPAGAGEDTRATPAAPVNASGDLKLQGIDAEERAEVVKTLALIARGGPFPHRQDGSIFSNREQHLPQKPRGYYREYTVETRGADTRGARRIVRGGGGETYYTNDHYRTFVRVE